jgi:acetyl esterase/lipase
LEAALAAGLGPGYQRQWPIPLTSLAPGSGSAGAHLSALAALSAGDPAFQPGFEEADTSVQAAVPCYGVYDWTPPNAWPHLQAYLLQFGIMSRPYPQARELYERASPLHRVGPHAPPFLVLHGSSDVFAPVAQARRFALRLRAAGATAVYAELPGAQHAFDVLASPRARASAQAVGRFLAMIRRAWEEGERSSCSS